ncbi:tropomyosin-2-like [Nicotiana tomentosiformis]|uniref:tropomyosin-2-like n=1 Tax=Nicotiana tomentosiformis TaxID=4098 RepID=UPI00388CA534
MEQVNNLEASLHSKAKEANTAEEKRAKIKERLKRIMEKNQLHSRTNVELNSKISIMKAENEKLKSKINKLQAKLQDKEDSTVFVKSCDIYHTKRKTLEEAKEGIANTDECIAKAQELETTAYENLPDRPVGSDS